MDAAKHHRDMSDPTWRRWSLLAALLVLGCLYVIAYAIFVARSEDFIVALRNHSAQAFSLEHVISPPANLEFGLGHADTARLGGGWYYAEAGGVWSAQDDAWIQLNLHRTDSARVVYLSTTAFVAERHPRITVAVDVNDTELGSWMRDRTNASEPLDIHVPQSLARTGQLAIHLHINHGASPFDTRSGPDKRRLGLLLHSMEVR